MLAFIFDHLLPASFTHSSSIPTIAKLAKTFLHCLATSNYTPEAISAFVTEFKAAFSRATNLPESQLKHSRIRALTGLLSQVLDNQNGFSNRAIINPSQFARLLIRKGFISDLARAVHNINLGSPSLSSTVNSILKPLEVLTRIVNQVASVQKKGKLGGGGGEVAVGGNALPTSTSSRQLPPQLPPPPRPETEIDRSYLEPGSLPSLPLLPTQAATSALGVPYMDVGVATTAATPSSHTAGDTTPAVAGGRGRPVPHHDESNILEATHESLIPLEEEEDEEGGDGEGDMDRELLHEARSLAREIGRHGTLPDEIQDIVDELLEREPSGSGVGGGALIRIHTPGDESDTERSSEPESITESDLEEEEEDNFNSAGEELDEDEGDESRVVAVLQQHHHGSGAMMGEDEVGSDLSSSQTDTDDNEDEEEHEEEEGGEGGEEGFEVDAEAELPSEGDNNRVNVADDEVCGRADHIMRYVIVWCNWLLTITS